MKKNLLTLALPLLLISCIEVRDANEEKEVPAVESTPVAEVRALAQPHQYAVLIKSEGNLSKIFRKSINFLTQTPTVQIQSSDIQAEDIVDKPGQYEYSVQQGSKYYQLQVEIPEDYVVDGNMKIEQLELNVKNESDEFRVLESSGRLFFKAGSKLTTDGENFHIKVAMVDSEGARVETFPNRQEASAGAHGRHGGKIKIEAQSMRGTLHFVMRGEKGGAGDKVDNNGRNGGNSGYLEASIQDSSNGDITFDLFPGDGGIGVEIRHICIMQPCGNTLAKPKGNDGAAGIAQQPKMKK